MIRPQKTLSKSTRSDNMTTTNMRWTFLVLMFINLPYLTPTETVAVVDVQSQSDTHQWQKHGKLSFDIILSYLIDYNINH